MGYSPTLIEKERLCMYLSDLMLTYKGTENDDFAEHLNEIIDIIAQFPVRNEVGLEPKLEEGETLVHCSYADGHSGFERRPFLDWMCPSCGYYVGELYCGSGRYHIQGEHSYCSRCGQKIDWEKPKLEEKRRYEQEKEREREEWERKHRKTLDNMNERRRIKYNVSGDTTTEK